MDFFEHQDVARRLSRRLVWLFAIAVSSIFILTYLVIVVFYLAMTEKPVTWQNMIRPDLLLVVGGGVVLVVGGGTLYRLSSLKDGGRGIAEMLGGQLIEPGSTDPAHRKVLNVVEEMAIASGVPVPPVYVMENEQGINAFAAGYSPSDAVVGVTRGCIDLLSRDELQGVMAHEFSHILHGDMRLNIRLIGLVFGILIIGLAGHTLIRAAMYGSIGRRRSSRDNPWPLALLGLALIILGALGVFFSRWIKAAISRQREYLADASAVQFTRNPDGIAGALKKIGGHMHGSKVRESQAEQASHMFFGQALSGGLSSLFATHPPLDERIRRIDPSFTGKFTNVQSAREPQPSTPAGAASGLAGVPAPAADSLNSGPADHQPPTVDDLVGQIGQLDWDHLQRAHQLLGMIPDAINEAVHEPFGARAVIFGLLLSPDQQVCEQQFNRIKHHGDQAVYQMLLRLRPHMKHLHPSLRVALIDLALPALRELSDSQYAVFRQNLVALIEADRKISLFEWSLQRIVLHHLDINFGHQARPQVRYRRLQPVAPACAVLLSALAYVGHDDDESAERAFRQAARRLQLPGLKLLPAEQVDLRKLDDALTQLAQLAPQPKRSVVTACAVCITTDAQITVRELELFRAVADVLDCPVPPMMATA